MLANRLPELGRFAAVGGLTLVVYLGLFAGLTYLGLGNFWAALAAAAVGVAISYALQRGWTFNSRAPVRKSLPTFLIIHISGAILNAAVIELATGLLALPSLAGLALGAAVYGIYSYSAQKLWCFPE